MADSLDAAPRPDVGAFFAEVSQYLLAEQDEQATLRRICERVADVIPASDFSGITVRRRRGRLETLAHSDETALRCDELQYTLREGPCVAAALLDEPFLVRATESDPRWPRWGPKVAELGVHSIISIQLSSTTVDPERDPLGAINIYSRKRDAFAQADVERAVIYGVHAANALAAAKTITSLGSAMTGRHLIGVAQGVLMRRYDVTMDQAFETLQRYSSHANIKLRDLAVMVAESGGLPKGYDVVPVAERPDPESS